MHQSQSLLMVVNKGMDGESDLVNYSVNCLFTQTPAHSQLHTSHTTTVIYESSATEACVNSCHSKLPLFIHCWLDMVEGDLSGSPPLSAIHTSSTTAMRGVAVIEAYFD